MPFTTLPTKFPGEKLRASYLNLNKANTDDLDSRVDDLETAAVGGGDVVGPASATVDAPAVFDGTTGKLIKAGAPLSLAGVGAYLSLVGPVLTRALIDLVVDVTGRLPWANVAAAPAANRLLGRGSAGGAGDWEPIALGAGLSLSGTTLSATGGGSAGTLDDLTDVAITTPITDDVLTYDGADWVNAPVPDPPGLATHIADTANPHVVTKAQVGLGSVENYAVASQAEAEAGTEAAKYMTPLRTAEAIAALASGSGDVSGPASSVDGEIALFDSTTGKLLKRATGTGFVHVASGVHSAAKLKRVVGAFLGDGVNVISTGVAGYVSCPVACTITKVRLLSSDPAVTSGSIVVDIWKDTYANYPPTVADTITASAKPTITTATKSEDAVMTGWTTSVAEGDVFGFSVDSVTSLKRVSVELTVEES